MFLNLTLASGHTSPIIASGILNPALAHQLHHRLVSVRSPWYILCCLYGPRQRRPTIIPKASNIIQIIRNPYLRHSRHSLRQLVQGVEAQVVVWQPFLLSVGGSMTPMESLQIQDCHRIVCISSEAEPHYLQPNMGHLY